MKRFDWLALARVRSRCTTCRPARCFHRSARQPLESDRSHLVGVGHGGRRGAGVAGRRRRIRHGGGARRDVAGVRAGQVGDRDAGVGDGEVVWCARVRVSAWKHRPAFFRRRRVRRRRDDGAGVGDVRRRMDLGHADRGTMEAVVDARGCGGESDRHGGCDWEGRGRMGKQGFPHRPGETAPGVCVDEPHETSYERQGLEASGSVWK